MSHDSRATRPIPTIRVARRRCTRTKQSQDHAPFPRGALLVVASAIFISMSTEFLPGGLLPNISSTFGRPVTDVGQLVTVFATAVILTTAPLAVVTRKVPRKPLAIIALIGITAVTALAALAPTFEVLLAARAFGGIAHGLFWSVAAAYAANLVPSSQLGRATAITAAGGSVAGVLGGPLGNLLGQLFGWRAAFAVFAVLGVGVVILVLRLLPSATPIARPRRSVADDRSAAPSALPSILLVCLTILILVIGQTTYGTYSVVWLGEAASIPPAAIPAFLFGSGLAAFVAVSAIGRVADRFPIGALVLAVILVALLNMLYPFAAAWGIIALVIISLGQAMAFALVPLLLQARMMRTAPPHQRSTAAALQTTAFNIAIGGGAVLGALVVESWGIEALPGTAALCATVGLVVLLLSSRPAARSADQSPAASSSDTEATDAH
ncbi:MFS transporter [Microbacterium sp. B2969]|uniref:MFS transporter n=1 Tax=Microbacterium alkaliflavum TaxID=3248839 RepID=A0ABW7Q3D7_9MICO